MTHRIMRDSTRAVDIPVKGTQLVAGYANGRFLWTASDWARFPGIPHVHIDVNGSLPHVAGVLDVETGDATVRQAVQWAKVRHDAGDKNPVIYCNRSTLTPLFNAMGAAGFGPGHGFRLWIATLDGKTLSVPDMTGVVAVQYAGEKHTGGHYDESIVYDDAWHPVPLPAQHGYLVKASGLGGFSGHGVTSEDGGKTWH
jgi:hypothetical protein